jgi:hypothetical protein
MSVGHRGAEGGGSLLKITVGKAPPEQLTEQQLWC